MSKEGTQNQSLIVPIWIKVFLGAISVVVMVWGTAWLLGSADAADSFLLSSHEVRITKVESELGVVDSRLDNTEKMQQSLASDQRNILNNQRDMKLRMEKESDLRTQQRESDRTIQMELIKEVGGLSTYLKSIEKIE